MLFENVFNTVAFQTALVCTFAEAIQEAHGSLERSSDALVDEYVSCLNDLFAPRNLDDLKRLMQTFEGSLETEPDVKVVAGGPTFRQVVLPGELQPAEWPKFRYVLVELWKATDEKVRDFLEQDRVRGRKYLAQNLYQRRLRAYCEEHRVLEADVPEAAKHEILQKAKASFEEFLSALLGKRVNLARELFEPSTPGVESSSADVSAK
jgi:hypothetical protein